VERLADTSNPRIRHWLLRKGYKNSIMNEYLAYTCATAGGLLAELSAETIDEELLAATGEIIEALIAGGPAEGVDDYADGPLVVTRYLHHLGAEPSRLEQLLAVNAIKEFVCRERDWTGPEGRGWTAALRATLHAQCQMLEALPRWKSATAAGLESDDESGFWLAQRAAHVLGIDAWEKHYRRLQAGKDDWYFAMQTSDSERIDRVVVLAEQRLPLDAIATGPAEETGMGPEWSAHGQLDFVLQDLRRFPGKGWTLICAGLSSPVIRNRHMALRALSPWQREQWPPDAEQRLRRALELEMNKDVRDEIRMVLDGTPIPEPRLHLRN
jgi:hypothetical protein